MIFAEENKSTGADKDKEHHQHKSETLHNLLHTIKYDRVVRPGGDQAVQVNMSMFIMHMAWAKNELCMTAFVRQAWTDSRLTSPVTVFIIYPSGLFECPVKVFCILGWKTYCPKRC